MAILQLATKTLTLGQPSTYLIADSIPSTAVLSVKNITGFASNQIILIGEFGNGNAEILKTNVAFPPTTGGSIFTSSLMNFAHSSSTLVTVLPYDQIELSTSTTLTGAKTVLNSGVPFNIVASTETTNYNDTLNSTGYYFVRFYNSINSTYSTYSAPIPAGGYTQFSARAVIDTALGEINQKTSSVLTDVFAFQQIDMCQMECVQDLKRWSFMQKFDQIFGQISTGSWKLPLPADVDDQNTNKSIYSLRIGGERDLTWVDKDTFDKIIGDTVYTTLLNPIALNATTITLTNSGDFPSTGTIQIGANSYTYTANSKSTGVLTIPASTTTNIAGTDVFYAASSGLPQYWTTYGGVVYFYPIMDSYHNGRNLYGDYYSKLVQTTADNQSIIVPDPTLVQTYLSWKFLKKLNNGEDTAASAAYQTSFEARKLKMKNKEVKNRTFKLKPKFNDFANQMGSDESSKKTRTGNFSNTGL